MKIGQSMPILLLPQAAIGHAIAMPGKRKGGGRSISVKEVKKKYK